MTLESERLLLTPWEQEDWQPFHAHLASDPRVMRYITGGVPWTEEQAREFVTRQQRHYLSLGYCMWKLTLKAEKAECSLAGFCGIQPIVIEGEQSVEIGWWLAERLWGQGLATEAARAALADAYGRCALERIIAFAVPENLASRNVMEKIGLTYLRDAVYRGSRVVVYAGGSV